jgi:hypothetical protein
MYDPVKPAYIFDRRAGTTYYGYLREDDQRWLIKFLVIAPNGDVSESYANILNNGGYATLDLAWPDRAILTYDPDQAVAERKPFFGGVTGPISSVDGTMAVFDGISGRVIKQGAAPLADAPSNGLTYGRMDGSWVQAQPRDVDLDALAAFITTGFAARLGAGSWAPRSINGSGRISVANSAGTAGDPLISISLTGGNQVVLSSEVTGDLPLANIVPASAASRLLGRGSAGGAGDFQELTLGDNIELAGTVLNVVGGGYPKALGYMGW